MQKFIPLSCAALRAELLGSSSLSEEERRGLEQVADMLEAIYHHRLHALQKDLIAAYEPLDPDEQGARDYAEEPAFLEALERALGEGNWERIGEVELEAALNGEDLFPVSLQVRFDELEETHLFHLGQVEIEERRPRLFGLKQVEVTVPCYEYVLQVLRFKERSWFEERRRLGDFPEGHAAGLHLRLFKSVPKLDLETIFPNTSPSMRTLDKIKIASTLVGGLVSVAIKFGPALLGIVGLAASGAQGRLDLALLGGILSALGTYAVKTYTSYRKTREDYLARVARDLYFKVQANNRAVIHSVVDLAEQQEVKEALLAYTFLRCEAHVGHTAPTLDARVEAWLRERDLQVDFEISDALAKLLDLGLLRQEGQGAALDPQRPLEAASTAEALARMDEYWDGVFDFARPQEAG